MATRKYRPNTPATRFRSVSDFSNVSAGEPEKSLLAPKKRISGRNNNGRITVRRRGGGVKRKIRIIDFARKKEGVTGIVKAFHYDPNRGARLALIFDKDGEKRYILAPQGLEVGDTVQAGAGSPIKPGNTLALADIPLGELVHNIELRPGAGGVLVRGAGGSAQLMAKDGKYAQVKLPSGEQRRILLTCRATIGSVGNSEHANESVGKAGASRWKGRRPKVRGVAMNPVDHPHGGGEGKTSGGRHPVTPWGKPTKGFRTRSNKRTDKFIVRRRKK